MRIQKILLTGVLLLLTTIIRAQSICSFDEKYNTLLQQDPAFAQKIEQSNRSIERFIISKRGRQNNTSKRSAAVVYTIPVVVHVMHAGGAVGSAYNPSDAQIQAAISYINQVYAGTWPGMKPQQGAGAVTDIEIRFALAQRSPGCGSTNGIDRVDASGVTGYTLNGINVSTTGGANELDLKNVSRWDPSKYYNIWLVNKIDGMDGTSGQFVAGYAYYPGVSPQLDGTVMLATQLLAGNKVLPHELGHALGVHHTFRGSINNSNCPVNNNCATDGDMVCDTDPVTNNETGGIYDFTCRTGPNNCLAPATVNYSVNTEENIMAYTNCANLFTEGQKERMHAAMQLASRSSLVDHSNPVLTACGTGINFSLSQATVRESDADAIDGCRRYKDYQYQMVIGAAPSTNATVTLQLTGSAIRGADYEVTTTGSFTNQSDQLQFDAGAANPQAFLVRVYDDASTENSEDIIFNFTVSNNGGDATKGNSIPAFTLTIRDNNVQPVAAFTGVVTLGSNTALVQDAPYNATLSKQRVQMLYRANELKALGLTAGEIRSIAWHINQKSSNRAFGNFTIKIGGTSLQYIVDGETITIVGGLTTVYSVASQTTVAGWNTYNFTNPFIWDGESSVLVEVCYNNTTSNTGAGRDRISTYSDGSATGQANMIFNETGCNENFTGITYYPNGRKPIVRFGIMISGTEIETELGASQISHIGISSSEYLYNNNKLIARIFNTDNNLDCVSASLTGAGTAWESFSGGQRSAKAFTISPAVNGSTTGYTVSLYFNNDELNGLNPANLRIAKTSAASITDANTGNTVIATPVVSTLGSTVTVFTANFTGFSTFFLVTNSVVLPINLLYFSGKVINEQNIALQWSTSFEDHNIGFDIERSSDGKIFSKLSTIHSKGDTRVGHSYYYSDDILQPGTYYYRLKQKDADGKFEYSKVLTFKVAASEGITLAPVPARDYVNVKLTKPADQKTILQLYSATSQKLSEHVMQRGSYHLFLVNWRQLHPGR